MFDYIFLLAKDVLIENIKANDALVILGETGSGKTTRKIRIQCA